MDHFLTRATIIPEIIVLIQREYNISEQEAMERFYNSNVSIALDDDETGLYGQSPYYIFSLFLQETS